MVMPSWKHIMNYESLSMSADEMVDATYAAALDINRVKGAHGIAPEATSRATDKRIRDAREQMHRLDAVLRDSTPADLDRNLAVLKEEFERLSENTVAEKNELNWGFRIKPTHVAHLAGLGIATEARNLAARVQGKLVEMLGKLVGSESDMAGIAELSKLLGGE